MNKWTEELTGGAAWDDVSGARLEPNEVREARREDMEFFREMKAYTRCPRSKIAEVGGQLIDVRWIDVNKGDFENPFYIVHDSWDVNTTPTRTTVYTRRRRRSRRPESSSATRRLSREEPNEGARNGRSSW